ncbi:MAG TPA: phospholipase D-like domain-containing protein, partial [Terriglobales bacterium]|nr:phospholipase D-like domain-containing protein [Terriglobales bacterium]
AKMRRNTGFEVLTNGERFYEAMLASIRQAEHSVNLECYIFQRGTIALRFIDALAERARAGVKVNLVLDGLGSLTTTDEYLKPVTDAGGKLAWYHPLRWNTWPRYNNRTHRELLVIDGREAFIGGAGIADHWYTGNAKHPRWRDTVLRIEGESVLGLQGTFAENWLESQGEILFGNDYFPEHSVTGDEPAMVVNSAPSPGGATRARLLFQTLVASARDSIRITTPYFLPDQSLRRELERALQRGVEVTIIAPGRKSDHALTRNSSRRHYGELLAAGARVYEYEPAMIHAKVLVVDSLWIVVGSTNCDNRSFGINDEVNLAAASRGVAERLEQDFRNDLAESREITLKEWRHRPVFDRMREMLGWVFERQQ